ncbi:Heavy metal-associated isoprenylated plant protein 26, partial [Ananas comosus]
IVEMHVNIDCPGCENKVRKALEKLEGVQNVDIDRNIQKVTVVGWADQKKVLDAARSTGRRAVLWPYPFNPEYHFYTQRYYHHHLPTQAYRIAFNTNSSSYNYHVHGYDDSNLYGYYQEPAYTHVVSDEARTMFSDDNPGSCAIM